MAATVQGGAEATRPAAETERRAVEAVERTTEAAAGTPGEAVQRPAQDASAFSQAFLELLQEQGRENLAAMTALSRALAPVAGPGDALEVSWG